MSIKKNKKKQNNKTKKIAGGTWQFSKKKQPQNADPYPDADIATETADDTPPPILTAKKKEQYAINEFCSIIKEEKDNIRQVFNQHLEKFTDDVFLKYGGEYSHDVQVLIVETILNEMNKTIINNYFLQHAIVADLIIKNYISVLLSNSIQKLNYNKSASQISSYNDAMKILNNFITELKNSNTTYNILNNKDTAAVQKGGCGGCVGGGGDGGSGAFFGGSINKKATTISGIKTIKSHKAEIKPRKRTIKSYNGGAGEEEKRNDAADAAPAPAPAPVEATEEVIANTPHDPTPTPIPVQEPDSTSADTIDDTADDDAEQTPKEFNYDDDRDNIDQLIRDKYNNKNSAEITTAADDDENNSPSEDQTETTMQQKDYDDFASMFAFSPEEKEENKQWIQSLFRRDTCPKTINRKILYIIQKTIQSAISTKEFKRIIREQITTKAGNKIQSILDTMTNDDTANYLNTQLLFGILVNKHTRRIYALFRDTIVKSLNEIKSDYYSSTKFPDNINDLIVNKIRDNVKFAFTPTLRSSRYQAI